MSLPTDHLERKAIPIYSAFIKFFPLALAAVAKHSAESNARHRKPGETIGWTREDSPDHPDCIARHLVDYAGGDKSAMKAIMWRAAAQLQLDEEERLGIKKEFDLVMPIRRDGSDVQTRPPEKKFDLGQAIESVGRYVEHGMDPRSVHHCLCGVSLADNPYHMVEVRSVRHP